MFLTARIEPRLLAAAVLAIGWLRAAWPARG